MTSDLVSTLELSTLLQMIVDAAKELTDSEDAALLLYNSQRNQLYFEAATVPLRSDDTLIAIPRSALMTRLSRYRLKIASPDGYSHIVNHFLLMMLQKILAFSARST